MRRLLLACMATLFALAVVGVASARGPQNEFAVGSAKSEVALLFENEHASFSVDNVPGPQGCEASGKIVYKSDFFGAVGGPLDIEVRLDQLVIQDHPGPAAAAAFAGPITRIRQGPPALLGDIAIFDAFDSGLSGGMGDQFLFRGLGDSIPDSVSFLYPSPGHLIEKGNIVIKATGLLP